jgi:hypothetical protein
VPVAVVFLLRAVVLVLLWGFVVAAVIAVRHDVFGAVAQSPAPAPTPRRRGKAATATRLAVIEGPTAGISVPLSSLPITIGRADSSTVTLSDDYVSNNHARLVPRGQDWLIEDVGSTNGTYIGDTKVTAPTVVPVGGRIKIGRNVLELRA